MSGKIEISRDLGEEILKILRLDNWQQAQKLAEAIAAPVVERQPAAYMYQHEETGLIGFVHAQQLERNWQKMNPRLVITGPVFASPPAPVVVVVLPERREPTQENPYLTDADHGWNACLNKVKELNQ